jgi:hypothetical protein
VFREPGFAIPGAEVQLALSPPTEAGSKTKKLKTATDARGEFVFHVPAGRAEYVVSTTAKGFKSQQKTVSVQAAERIEVTFLLEPESK